MVQELAVLPLRCGLSGRDGGGDFGGQHSQAVSAGQAVVDRYGETVEENRAGSGGGGSGGFVSVSSRSLRSPAVAAQPFPHSNGYFQGTGSTRRPLKPDVG